MICCMTVILIFDSVRDPVHSMELFRKSEIIGREIRQMKEKLKDVPRNNTKFRFVSQIHVEFRS